MDPFTIAAPIVGGIINNLFAGSRQSDAQDFATKQAAQAELNFRVNRQTAYQDTMLDMKNAGLNPILAYQRGATGSTMGPIATPSAAPVSDIGLGAAASTALQARRQQFEIANMQEQNNLLKAQTDKTKNEAITEANKPANVEASTENIRATTGFTFQQMEKGMADAMQSNSLSQWIAANPKLAQAMIVASFAGGKVGDALEPFANAIKGLAAGGGNSARPQLPTPAGNSSKSMNLKDQDMLLTPNTYKRQQPGYQPAPPHPGRGWFSDRFYGVDQ